MTLPRRWFLPKDDSVLDLLNEQWGTVRTSIDAVVQWARSTMSLSEATSVLAAGKDTEREQQRVLHRAVRAAFSTPLDAEDIYELGERINRLHRELCRLLEEARVDGSGASPAVADMLERVAEASHPLSIALARLPDASAADAADDAAEIVEDANPGYRRATAQVPQPDARAEINDREMYRRAELVVDAMIAIAHRTWYAVSKVS